MWIKVANIVLTFELKPKLPLFLVLITYLRLAVSTEALDVVTDFSSGESGRRDRERTDLCWRNAQLACFQSMWHKSLETHSVLGCAHI